MLVTLSAAKSLLWNVDMRDFYVYIMANRNKTLYVGMTNDLERRVAELRAGLSAFTARYAIKKLVYYEATHNPIAAIGREKEIKGWLRSKKVTLIETGNPEWDDLSEIWSMEREDSSLRSE